MSQNLSHIVIANSITHNVTKGIVRYTPLCSESGRDAAALLLQHELRIITKYAGSGAPTISESMRLP